MTDIQRAVVYVDGENFLYRVQDVLKSDHHIVYVHYAEMPNFAMLKAANETRVFTKNQAQKAYGEVV